MRRLIIPFALGVFFLALADMIGKFAGSEIGLRPLNEQLNGTLPAGVLYKMLTDYLSIAFNAAALGCGAWLGYRIYIIIKTKVQEYNEKH